MPSAEIVVIGSGIIGSSTAYYLAKAGADVLLVDRASPNTGGTASQACAGGVRQQGRSPEEIPLAIYAIGLWDGLEAELEADLHYRRDGMTVMTDDENLIPVLQKRVSAEQALGLDVRLIPQNELHALIPGLSSNMIAGSYCPTDGHADPLRTIDAFIRAARRLGARVKWQCPVERIIATKNRVAAVQTTGEQINCRRVVLAAGYWSRGLAESVGLDRAETQSYLESDADADTVRAEDAMARQMGIQGVPFFIIDRKFAISGAQEPAVFLKAFAMAAGQEAMPDPA